MSTEQFDIIEATESEEVSPSPERKLPEIPIDDSPVAEFSINLENAGMPENKDQDVIVVNKVETAHFQNDHQINPKMLGETMGKISEQCQDSLY